MTAVGVPPLAELAPERRFRRLELAIARRLEGLLHGEHLGLVPGPGSQLGETRVYVPGEDDPRRMDWYVTARTTVPHVRDVIADRELETWAVVDLSASMDFGTAAVEKRDLAVAAVAAVGFMTARLGDRVGAYAVGGGGVRRCPARAGRTALYALLRSLIDSGGSHRAGPPPSPGPVEPDLGGVVRAVSRRHPKRGFRVVVSDFLEVAPDPDVVPSWESPLRELAARHQVLAVEVVDPRELALPNVGVIPLVDPETGVIREVDTGSARLRGRYAAAATAQREAVTSALRRCGVAHLRLRTDRDWIADMVHFALRQRRAARRLHAAPLRGAMT